MTMLVFTLAFAALWAGQLYLSWRQAKAFMAVSAQMRTLGAVATGRSKRRTRKTFASVAIRDGVITGCSVLEGVSVFARPKSEPSIVGCTLEEFKTIDMSHISTRAAMAITHAVSLYKPTKPKSKPKPVPAPAAA